jgi:glycosyltransferase involved in cell wall biosynthesis
VKRLGLVARADNGGIAAQTWQFARRMQPEKILVVHADHTNRGRAQPERYEFDYGPEIMVAPRAPRPRHVDWLLEDTDSIYTVECYYGQEIPLHARKREIKTVLHGNPEMTGDELADVVWAPSPWMTGLLPGSPVLMPFPTDLELLPRRERRSEIRTLYHVQSEAFHDRNGTDLLLEACSFINHEVTLKIRSSMAPAHTEYRGLVTVEWVEHHDGMFYEHWDDDIDLFVLPRRFGGLSLPMQEAASLGLPIISLACSPNESVLPPQALVKATVQDVVGMRGGDVRIFQCDPRALARKINELIENRHTRDFIADRCWDWAQAISWVNLLPHYEAALR